MNNHSYMVRQLPNGLELLADLATDLRWTWSHAGDALWQKLSPETWEQTANPYVILQNLPERRLEELANDRQFKAMVEQLWADRDGYYNQNGWYKTAYPEASLHKIAYFSMEYGLGESLPLYAGGLGILAGDYLKAASDLGVPVVGVGLLYQEGYFRQMLDANGWQENVYPYNDPATLPVQPMISHSGSWLHVTLQFPGRPVRFRVWRAIVGRVDLYLLDSNDPLNSPSDRGITSKLYGGSQEIRLCQEIALGLGGWRLLEALGIEIDVCHLNEGHAAFVTLERARQFMERHKIDFWQALWATRGGNIFTTHTPVAAGFDTFPLTLLQKYCSHYTQQLGITPDTLGALGKLNPADQSEPFNMAYLAKRTCQMTNGVSKLHGEVSRRIFSSLYPRWPECEVPVMHITNGVHVPTWDSSWADAAWTRSAGKERWRDDPEVLAKAILENLSDESLWTFVGQERADLVNYARKRMARQLGQRGEDEPTIAQAGNILDPNILILGFARRFAEYKRPNLLLHDQERLVRILTNSQYPVQLIVAGKAHPQDETGKNFIQQWSQFVRRPEVRHRVVFLEDYDITLAQEMVQGVDVWINTPRRPWEACGTSGMKVLVNGGLNISELDGWWAEAYTPEVGWCIGDGREHPEPGWDGIEAEELYRVLEEKVIPEFYKRDAAGIPQAWVTRMRASMMELAPYFSTNRMMKEYVEKMYLPAAAAYQRRVDQGCRLARELHDWDSNLRQHWQGIHWGNLEVHKENDGWSFDVQVYLGGISPDCVKIQLFADRTNDNKSMITEMERGESIPGSVNGFHYCAKVITQQPANYFTQRVIAAHSEAVIPAEMNLIYWWSA
ncbi:alpha-glucan family phosphorylase [Desulforhopalus sp. IMCC35007]|uniref:alpha-glucan family phosphorylase n=1 Tax=Desulforhopalus sp. IMCC35007 TaxID=2569543 RepID=UPI0010AE73AA|nr:alpha-glucan family phosphorylase [Desulforhopalus sp. IMCC35007]TKB07012.1 glycosyltransferase family 1 protein [Desulforhopalus sp. IMCC35007]